MGFGYAPWTGGAVQFVNSYGVAQFAERAEQLADAYGDRFRPPAALLDKAARGETF
jgi:3-hydroxyacyl-CoA dehydrogenase / enoyl-CoA hydratase / 3-hydroxybutyryl-CoA epimerase